MLQNNLTFSKEGENLRRRLLQLEYWVKMSEPKLALLYDTFIPRFQIFPLAGTNDKLN